MKYDIKAMLPFIQDLVSLGVIETSSVKVGSSSSISLANGIGKKNILSPITSDM
jgi:hypothetical protein